MNKDKLIQALKLAKSALGDGKIPSLDNFFFNGNKVTAFDGSVEISVISDEYFPFDGAIQGKSFYDLVKSLDKDLVFEINNDILTVKAGRSRTKFPIYNPDTSFLNDMDETNTEPKHLPVSEQFLAGMKRCMISISTKGLTPSGSGIHMFLSGGISEMYSSNGTTYSRYIWHEESRPEFDIFLPYSFCDILTHTSQELDKLPNSITVTDKYIRVDFDNIKIRHAFYATVVNRELKDMMDQGIDALTTVNVPAQLSESLKRSVLISSDAAVKLSFGNVEEKKLNIYTVGTKGEELTDDMEFEYPTEGSLVVDVKTFSKVLETATSIGFGPDFLMLEADDKKYAFICLAKG